MVYEINGKKYYTLEESSNILDENIKKRIFKLSRADQDAKIVFINDEINSYKDKKVYFFHQNLRLSEKLINQHQQTDYFVQFSFKDFDLEKLNNKFDQLLKDLSKDDLIVVDLNLSIFKPLFENNISVDMIVQNVSADNKRTDVTFTIKREDLEKSVN